MFGDNIIDRQFRESIKNKIEKLESDINELRVIVSRYPTSTETVNIRIKSIEGEIEALKKDNDIHYANNSTLQATLARLEEITKYLKESLALNQQSTQVLMDKVDKMYELMLMTTKQVAVESKPDIQIINDSNNKSLSNNNSNDKNVGHSGSFTSKWEELKNSGVIIVLLICIIIFLLTGHWIFPSLFSSH